MAPLPKILLGVTIDMSIGLMRGFPQYLAENGWDVHVVSSPGPLLDDLAGVAGVTAHAVPMRRNPSPFTDLRSLAAWVRLLRRVRPDVLSVGTPKAGLLGGLAGFLTRVPTRVYLLRGLRLETTSGLQRRILIAVERLSVALSHKVLAVSRSLRQRAIGLGVVKHDKISVLGLGSSNGVDVAAFNRANFTEEEIAHLSESLGLIMGVPVIGFVGRLTADKGLHVLAEARTLLTRDGVDHQILIVGGIDGESGRVRLDRSRNASRPAIITGYVSAPAIYYQLMDLLCLPTLREGFPNVVLEAGAAGIPTVTTTATGAVDSVVDGETGFTVATGSAQALADKLAVLVADPQLRGVMGGKARAWVGESFGTTRVWLLTQQFYADCSSRGNRANTEAISCFTRAFPRRGLTNRTFTSAK